MSESAGSGTALLRRLRAPSAPPQEACALCGARLGSEHRHLADIERRALACCCGACAMLFDRPGAAGGRFRSLPSRVLVDPDHHVDAAVWAALGIPVGTAFVLRDAAQDRVVLFYPSPAGATESQADDDAWRTLRQATRLAGLLEPDVEALLLRRDGDRVDCYLVPVDACYELVGRMRLHWHGFDGGSVARSELDAFFGRLAERSDHLAARESA
ncbi:DUF5947 family protein [Yinghuangia seranimata]|uniref:DUF5947 family protein n=1 Tax=Yinghuangia seranimata TaxID=408067 RepID=UPI00248BB9FF|nr:DUF5947 family protein [Yinghuangia seranimata]MDI2128310.1 DUF5947 family protein [Yinghuangia seranimata]